MGTTKEKKDWRRSDWRTCVNAQDEHPNLMIPFPAKSITLVPNSQGRRSTSSVNCAGMQSWRSCILLPEATFFYHLLFWYSAAACRQNYTFFFILSVPKSAGKFESKREVLVFKIEDVQDSVVYRFFFYFLALLLYCMYVVYHSLDECVQKRERHRWKIMQRKTSSFQGSCPQKVISDLYVRIYVKCFLFHRPAGFLFIISESPFSEWTAD